jgi:hypothetical protein
MYKKRTIASGAVPFDIAPVHSSSEGWITQLLMRIRSEYEEMPGLCLTRPQARRLWGLDEAACDAILSALVDAGYLRMSQRGYMRA